MWALAIILPRQQQQIPIMMFVVLFMFCLSSYPYYFTWRMGIIPFNDIRTLHSIRLCLVCQMGEIFDLRFIHNPHKNFNLINISKKENWAVAVVQLNLDVDMWVGQSIIINAINASF